MFRRFFGDLGDGSWDSTSGQSLWALLYYPDALAEQNPAEVWGLAWKDPSMGMFVLRNRYQDVNDTVFQVTANLRPTNGGHKGPDDLSFRLWSLGVPWVVGAGRNYSNPVGGQSTLSPNNPSAITNTVSAINNSVVDTLLRADGDGSAVVVLTVVDNGQSHPPVSSVGTANNQTITLGAGSFNFTIGAVAVGSHTIKAIAIGSAANHSEAAVPIKVNNSVPPAVAITWPGPTQQFYDQQSVTLRGTVSDPDGTINRVEVWWAGSKLGNDQRHRRRRRRRCRGRGLRGLQQAGRGNVERRHMDLHRQWTHQRQLSVQRPSLR